MDKCRLCGDTIKKNQKRLEDAGFPVHSRCVAIANSIVSVSMEHNLKQNATTPASKEFINYVEPPIVGYLH